MCVPPVSAELKMTVGIPLRAASSTGRDERPVVDRRQDDGVDAGVDHRLDDLDLLVAVVLAERALPDDLRPELAGGRERPGVDGLPELVRRAHGDDGEGGNR